jgi:hypothetical protein
LTFTYVERREYVARFQRQKLRPSEMLTLFKGMKERGEIPAVPNMTQIYDDIRVLKEEVKKWYYGQAKGDLLASHKLTIDVLEERQKKLLLIESDPNVPPGDRIKASETIANIELSIHNLLPYSEALMELTDQGPKSATESRLAEAPKQKGGRWPERPEP